MSDIFLTFVLSFFSVQGVVGTVDGGGATKSNWGKFWPPLAHVGLTPVEEISPGKKTGMNDEKAAMINFTLPQETMKALEEAFRRRRVVIGNGMELSGVGDEAKGLLTNNMRDGLRTHGVEMVHDLEDEQFFYRAHDADPQFKGGSPEAAVITTHRQWHLDGPLDRSIKNRGNAEKFLDSEKVIRIVCILFGPATPFPAFGVTLGWDGEEPKALSSMEFVGSSPQLKALEHNCVATINADGVRFWHGHVTPQDFDGHADDIYRVPDSRKEYSRIFLVIDKIVVRPMPKTS